MAITRAQQVRQMLKKGTEPIVQGGVDNYLGKQPQVVAPRKWQSGPDKPPTELAYITEAEKKLLLKEDIHGSLKKGPNQGPAGIISLDSFGDIGGGGAGGADTDAGGGARDNARFSGRGPSETKSAFDARVRNQKEIFQAAERKQARDLGIRERKNVIDMRRPGRLGRALGFNPLATLLGFINPVLGFATRGIMSVPGIGKKFKESKTLADFFKSLKTPTGTPTDDDDTTLLDQVDPSLPFAKSYLNQLQSKMTPKITIDDDMSLVPDRGLKTAPGDSLNTPFQQDIKQDNFLDNAMAELSTTQLDFLNSPKIQRDLKEFGRDPKAVFDMLPDYEERRPELFSPLKKQEPTTIDEYNQYLDSINVPRMTAADGGVMGGGIMDAAGRQNYFLGKLVKKATRAVKKIVKSPIGKLGIGAALAFTPFGKTAIGKFAGLSNPMKALIGGAGLSALPLIFQEDEDEGQQLASMGSVGGQIDPRAYSDPRSVMFRAFRMAEGGRIGLKEGEGVMKMASNDANERLLEQLFEQFLEEGFSPAEAAKKAREAFYDRDFAGAKGGDVEPVAKKTMPLLDMDGQEMDLRAEGGFVPIGRMEKADDVPARLSKNEFVFTADAVRNAGEGDVDKGAEVMYNMMKNLESGGEVSEESQGLEGARNMFQTSKRLEEVI